MLAILVLSLLGSALAGVSIRMPYLNPAGVTYTSYSAAYGHLAPVAAAPLAAPVAAAPVAYAAHVAAPPVAAAPVAYAAHVAAPVVPAPVAYAAAPASAVVPVTKVSATPAVIQNVVDVAHPKLATRRYQIRRPAIQKQFYDIEERVVVRPAGSAVVELDQPLSTNQAGPTRVSPAVHVAQPLVRYSGAHAFHSGIASPLLYPTLAHKPVYELDQVQEQQQLQQQQQIQQQQLQQQQQGQQQLLQQQQQEQIDQLQQQQLIEQQQLQQQQQQDISPQPQPQPQPQPFPQPSQPQFDSEDSISVENPELSRSAAPQNLNLQQPLFRSQLQGAPQQQQQAQGPQQRTQLQEIQQEIQQIEQLVQQRQQQPGQLFQRTQLQEVPQLLRSGDGRFTQALRRTQIRPLDLSITPRPEISARQGPTGPTPLPASFRSSEQDVIPSARNLSPEENDSNQRALIELLTARGPVSEVRSASQPVRARVISATPAPRDAPLTDSQSQTRRVVVSRPIQTVQEVEVVEPFTKVERVAVHQPALLKSVHHELHHVPAVTPVPLAAGPVHYL